ncbi:MAG: hypothetical protein JXB42_10465 [Deltaproteobacteria bacterium]|nr:hypothetical protein [Deltaproteobacteria bacterium]
MERKKYYHYTLEEINGEQEYTYDYLIETENLEQAIAIANKHAGTFYLDKPEEVCDGNYVFFGGAVCVEIKSVTETSKEDFVKDMLQRAILRA